jgi:hypothetical protein
VPSSEKMFLSFIVSNLLSSHFELKDLSRIIACIRPFVNWMWDGMWDDN